MLTPLGKIIPTRKGIRLIYASHEYGVEFLCGRNGICGKCKVKLLDAEIAVDTFHEKD